MRQAERRVGKAFDQMISLFAENRARKGIFAFPCFVAFSPVYSAAHPYGEENTNDVFI